MRKSISLRLVCTTHWSPKRGLVGVSYGVRDGVSLVGLLGARRSTSPGEDGPPRGPESPSSYLRGVCRSRWGAAGTVRSS